MDNPGTVATLVHTIQDKDKKTQKHDTTKICKTKDELQRPRTPN